MLETYTGLNETHRKDKKASFCIESNNRAYRPPHAVDFAAEMAFKPHQVHIRKPSLLLKNRVSSIDTPTDTGVSSSPSCHIASENLSSLVRTTGGMKPRDDTRATRQQPVLTPIQRHLFVKETTSCSSEPITEEEKASFTHTECSTILACVSGLSCSCD